MQSNSVLPKDNSTMFCKLNMETGVVKTEISLDKVQETITKATALATKATFSWVPLNRPDEGFTMLYYTPSTQTDIPPDGYQWFDNEVVRGLMLPDGRKLEIIDRMQGFVPGEKGIPMTRRRYKIIGNVPTSGFIQLIHYLRHPDRLNLPQLTQPMMSMPRPMPDQMRPPWALYQQQQMSAPFQQGMQNIGQQSMPLMGNPGYRGLPGVPQSYRPQQTTMAPNLSKFQKTAAPTRPVEKEDSGDEADKFSPESISEARYKRNHEFLGELFSPYPISSIVIPKLFSDDLTREELEKKQKEESQKIENIQSLHNENFKNISSVSTKLTELYNRLNTVQGLEDFERCEKEIEDILNGSIHYKSMGGVSQYPLTLDDPLDMIK